MRNNPFNMSDDDTKMIESVEDAHPETKMIEDMEHAHPEIGKLEAPDEDENKPVDT